MHLIKARYLYEQNVMTFAQKLAKLVFKMLQQTWYRILYIEALPVF